MTEWREIEVPQGNFISWGRQVGQQVTVKVLSFDPTGGSDFNNTTCPLLIGTLVEDCDSYQEKGTKLVKHKAGEMVNVTAGLVNLKKGLLLCDPKRDDLVRMTFTELVKVPDGEVKVIKVEHASGGGADSVGEDDL